MLLFSFHMQSIRAYASFPVWEMLSNAPLRTFKYGRS